MEPFFLSSRGIGIYVHHDSPLYVAINNGTFCAMANETLTYSKGSQKAASQYDICKSEDSATLWKAMAKKYHPAITSQDMYMQSGPWTDMIKDKSLTEPKWLFNHTIDSGDVVYFTRH